MKVAKGKGKGKEKAAAPAKEKQAKEKTKKSDNVISMKGLARQLAEKYEDLRVPDAYDMLKEVFGTISSAFENGTSVSIHGFGTFVIKERAARKGRNPQTNEVIEIPASKAIRFKPSRTVKQTVKEA